MLCRVSFQRLSKVLISWGNVDSVDVAGISLYLLLLAPLTVCAHSTFPGVSVGVGSHQEHLTLRETRQRWDLVQRKDSAMKIQTITSIIMCMYVDIKFRFTGLCFPKFHIAVDQYCYPAPPTVCTSYQLPLPAETSLHYSHQITSSCKPVGSLVQED